MNKKTMVPNVALEIEKDFDAFIEFMKDKLEKDKENKKVHNFLQYEKMNFVESVLKKLASFCNAEVKSEVSDVFESEGSVTIEGKHLEFPVEWFARAAEFADNMEIYPLAKNAVRISFAFHNLTKRSKDDIMEYKGCRDIAVAFTEEALVKYGKEYVVSEEKKNAFDDICKAVDDFVSYCDNLEVVEVSADNNKGCVFTIVAEILSIDNGRMAEFIQDIRKFDNLRVERVNENIEKIELTIDNFWVSR